VHVHQRRFVLARSSPYPNLTKNKNEAEALPTPKFYKFYNVKQNRQDMGPDGLRFSCFMGVSSPPLGNCNDPFILAYSGDAAKAYK
ncbi:hypothetical protein, partial [Paenibacillus sp. MSJ-34]|uniref:hypothetical protein n=1 Tax=Paenibacillus sp. MSJ-34 TaxID=2841529 RepID=UPI001C1236C6